MALTPEQQSRNNLARKARDAAYRKRYKAYRDEIAAAQARAQRETAGDIDDAENAFTDLFAKRRDQLIELDRQIAELQRQKAELISKYDPHFDRLKAAKDSAYCKRRQLEAEAKAEIDSRYPDIVGVYSASGWKDWKEFLTNE